MNAERFIRQEQWVRIFRVWVYREGEFSNILLEILQKWALNLYIYLFI